MQGGIALRRGVRIGAAIEEAGGELVVRVGGGEQKRVEPDFVGRAGRRWPRCLRILAVLTGSESFMSAPAFSSASTAAMRPSRAANSSAVNPAFDRVFRSAPRATSRSITVAWPSAAAHISAVCPRQPSLALGSAPRASSRFTASVFPVRAATISAVSPSAFADPASAPPSSSIAIVFALPLTEASHSGVAP